jgi:hypothetical protein
MDEVSEATGEHAWPNIVSDPAALEAALLSQLSISAVDFEAYRISMHEYRDKFVAHLDSESVMNIPNLDIANASVAFYHNHVASQETSPGDLAGLPESAALLSEYYQHCADEAERVCGKISAEA